MAVHEQRGELLEAEKTKQKPPPLYKVLLLNDDYTPMDFVVVVLQTVFGMTREKATRVMLQVHREGMGVCGTYTREVAAAKSRPSVVATDVRGHWASRWIMDVIRAGVMDVLPNHTFQPKAAVRRSELAQTCSRLLAIAGASPGRAERARVSMADVGAGHLSYDDIAAAVAAGVLALDGGNFRPSRVVTGQEAADAIGRLERITSRSRGGNR